MTINCSFCKKKVTIASGRITTGDNYVHPLFGKDMLRYYYHKNCFEKFKKSKGE